MSRGESCNGQQEFPPTAEEQLEERRLAEIQEMDLFILKTFGLQLRMELKMKTIYRGTNTVVQMTLDGYIFQLRKDGPAFVLFALKDSDDVELTRVDRTDPNFTDRVLVAIADALLAKPRS